jgi:hypothetical protein
VGPANSHRDSVRVQCKRVRLLPNQQILEVTHPRLCGEGSPRSASLSRVTNPSLSRTPQEGLPAWKLQSL